MKKIISFLITTLLVFSLAACSTGAVTTISDTSQSITVSATAAAVSADSAAAALAENDTTHDDEDDYQWEVGTEIPIVLNGTTINADHPGVTVSGSTATITAAGTYSLSGTLNDGQIIVDTGTEGIVQLILNSVDLRNSTNAPIQIVSAKDAIIILADDTQNFVSDGTEYTFANPEDDEPNAAIFSKVDLTISGNGALTVAGNFNDGIASKDGLVIASGSITVTAADDGIRGKDYFLLKNGSLTITAGGDGLKADNAEDTTRGYVAVESGTINITAGGDAISAQTDVIITGGDFAITSGGGSDNTVDETTSAKGIKALVNLNIDGGTFTIDSADDAIHSNGSLTINGGTFQIASGDDGMHADSAMTVNNGDIQITKSYEGIESAVITLNSGNIHVVASDDGINVAGGVDGSGMGGPGARPGGRGQDTFTYTGSYYLFINGGNIVVDAQGDGLDANGAIEMTNGTVVVNGPTEQMNGALDYDAGFKITGGTIVAAGSSGMAQTPGSGQNSLLIYLQSTQPAGTLVHIQNSAGDTILTFAPTKSYQSIAFSSPNLASGETYEIFTGGSSSGEAAAGLYQGGSYTPGSSVDSFTISGIVTTIGTGGGRPGRP